MNKDLVIAKLTKMNNEKDNMIVQLLDENETLEGLIKEVKGTLKDFKRKLSGNQVKKLFGKLETLTEVDTLDVKKKVVMYVSSQRTNRNGLHKVFKAYLKARDYEVPAKIELGNYTDLAFESFVNLAQSDANMALSVLSSMLVVLLDVSEEKAKAPITEA